MKPDSSIRFYTGFPSFDVLLATFRALCPNAKKNCTAGSNAAPYKERDKGEVFAFGHLGQNSFLFQKSVPNCRGIIDASKIRVQAPSSLILNSEMYSGSSYTS